MPRLPFVLLPMLVATVALAAPDAARKRELLHLLRQDCGSCHGMTLKGGLGPPLLPERLRDRDIDELTTIILEGVPGTPMPPWSPELTAEEARWLAQQLKRGAGS